MTKPHSEIVFDQALDVYQQLKPNADLGRVNLSGSRDSPTCLRRLTAAIDNVLRARQQDKKLEDNANIEIGSYASILSELGSSIEEYQAWEKQAVNTDIWRRTAKNADKISHSELLYAPAGWEPAKKENAPKL